MSNSSRWPPLLLSSVCPACQRGSASSHSACPPSPAAPPCSRILVFTAGLLLRLLKTGVYTLAHASFMLLLDAFTGGHSAAAGWRHGLRLPAGQGGLAALQGAGLRGPRLLSCVLFKVPSLCLIHPALATRVLSAPGIHPAAVVRNHPSNTLVREYWRNAEEGARPRVVGVLASQLPSKPRPFDRLRQNLRKLCHSLQVGAGSKPCCTASPPLGLRTPEASRPQAKHGQAPRAAAPGLGSPVLGAPELPVLALLAPPGATGAPACEQPCQPSCVLLPAVQARLLLPTGCGLAQMEAQLHHDSIQLHSYALGTPEERLASLLQQHLLGMWDVLHEYGLNHFGRLVQFAAAGNGGGAGAGSAAGTPSTPATGATPVSAERGGGAPAPSPPQQAAQGPGRGPSTPLAARPPSAAGSPATIEGSPATPLLTPPGQPATQHGTSSAAAAAAEQPDPMQHDWAQVELQVRRLPAALLPFRLPPRLALRQCTRPPACWLACLGNPEGQPGWGVHGIVCAMPARLSTVSPSPGPQVVHSLWHSNALPSRGDHVREPDALALMMHVLDCVRALRWGGQQEEEGEDGRRRGQLWAHWNKMVPATERHGRDPAAGKPALLTVARGPPVHAATAWTRPLHPICTFRHLPTGVIGPALQGAAGAWPRCLPGATACRARVPCIAHAGGGGRRAALCHHGATAAGTHHPGGRSLSSAALGAAAHGAARAAASAAGRRGAG